MHTEGHRYEALAENHPFTRKVDAASVNGSDRRLAWSHLEKRRPAVPLFVRRLNELTSRQQPTQRTGYCQDILPSPMFGCMVRSGRASNTGK